jgi:hypothetical protein
MAAGLGFKTFTTGEVLTAADVNGYLMQGVLVFATAAARNAAITSPQEGQFAFTKDTNGLWYYDGAAWVASGATGDIEGVTAGTGISGGGTSGTVTVTNSMATAITTNGDIIYGTGSGTFTRLGIGSSAQVLTVAGGVPSWAAAGGSTFVGCSVYTSNITLSNATFTAVTWDSEAYDTDAIHSTSSNTSRFTIPSGKSGKWLLTSNLQYNTNSSSYRANRVKVNNTTFFADNYYPPVNGTETSCVMSLVMNLTAADYVEIQARQDTGGNLLLIGGAYGSWAMLTYLGA